jgi:hypothetical protein
MFSTPETYILHHALEDNIQRMMQQKRKNSSPAVYAKIICNVLLL